MGDVVDNERDPDLADIPIGYYRGSVDRLLLAIDGAGLKGAILVIESLDTEIVAPWVEERTAHRPELLAENRKATQVKRKILFIDFMAGSDLFLPIEGSNVRDLAALPAEIHRLAVQDEHGYGLLDAPDPGNNEIFVNDRTPAAVVNALRDALRDDLQ